MNHEINDYQFYKKEKEDFVSNLDGESAVEVLMAFGPTIMSILLTFLTLIFLNIHSYKNVQFLLQFFLIIIPSTLSYTLLSHVQEKMSIYILIITLVVNFLLMNQIRVYEQITKIQLLYSKQLSIITNFRAVTFLTTAICILAVDFPIFPRRFGKTETFGYSLMDTGVGLFVISNALVSPEIRSDDPISKNYFWSTLKKNIKGSLPLIILGISRSLFVEYFNYQQHISEYGVHWNFLITLACIKIVSSLIFGVLKSKYYFIPGFIILVIHEYVLTGKEFKNWILGFNSRDNFVTANREGIFSLPGYIGLFLCGISLGKMIDSSYEKMNKKTNLSIIIFRYKLELNYAFVLFIQLIVIAGTAMICTFLLEPYLRVSRRLFNFRYAMWVIAISTLILSYFMILDIIINSIYLKMFKNNTKKKIKFKGFSLEIFEAINYNSLCFFLLANVLTGLINMSIKTLYISSWNAVRILVGYIGANVLTVLFLYRYSIKLKL